MPTVLVYSEDPVFRDQVRLAIGRSPAPGVDGVRYLMAERGEQVVRAVEAGEAGLLVLDGEAWPEGGLGISRELKNSGLDVPPIVVVVGRRDDAWLGRWSQADAVLSRPIDAWELSRTAVSLLTGVPEAMKERA